MDITNPHFRLYAERVIRRLVEHVKNEPAVIGLVAYLEQRGTDFQTGTVVMGFNTSAAGITSVTVETNAHVKLAFANPDLHHGRDCCIEC